MSFSERMKIVPQKQIQIDDIDSGLRHRIINKVDDMFCDNQAKYVLDIMGYRTVPQKDILDISFSRRGKNLEKLTSYLETFLWNNVYDVIEYGYDFIKVNCKDCVDNCDEIYDEDSEDYYTCENKENMAEYTTRFNSVLEQGKAGYRIIDGFVSPIIGEIEISCIEEATSTKFHPVNTHLQKALQLYSDRENPDYENSIKESISAVEAMCCIITGMTGAQATLGNALKELEIRDWLYMVH